MDHWSAVSLSVQLILAIILIAISIYAVTPIHGKREKRTSMRSSEVLKEKKGETAMLRIGCHLSSSKGYQAMGKEAEKDVVRGHFPVLYQKSKREEALKDRSRRCGAVSCICLGKGIEKILAHAPYTLNGCSADENIRRFARETMEDDLNRMEYTPGNCYNFHPGSHVKQGTEKGSNILQRC